MTQDEAEALAAKRNAHKAPTLVTKEWRAVRDSWDWRVELVDNQWEQARKLQDKAKAALRAGDWDGFHEAAGDALLARVRATIGQEAGNG